MKHKVMLHEIYDAIYVIYDCNACACKLICCMVEENKALIAGDNEIFDCCQGK